MGFPAGDEFLVVVASFGVLERAIWVRATVWMARLIWRFPPRLSRCLTTRPELVSRGAVPLAMANLSLVGYRWGFRPRR